MTEKVLTRTERIPHTVDERTHWYREPRGGLLLLRRERDANGELIRTVTYKFRVRGGRVELVGKPE